MSSWLIPLFGVSLAAVAFLREGLFTPGDGGHTHESLMLDYSRICNTTECRQVANTMIDSMNKSVDPCVDFYEFACGSWGSSNAIPKYVYRLNWDVSSRFSVLAEARLRDELETPASRWDIFPIHQVKKYYKSCIDIEARESEGLRPIMSKFRQTNGWPMIMSSGSWRRGAKAWQDIDYFYERLLGINAFYSLDIYNSSSGHGELLIKIPELVLNYISDEQITVYRSVMKDITRVFIEERGTWVSEYQLEKDIDDLIKFEKALSEASKNYVDDNSYTDIASFMEWWNDNTRSISRWVKIDWAAIFQRLLRAANRPMTNDASFTIVNVDYIIQLAKILESTDERIIVNYIQWNFLLQVLPSTTTKVKDAFFPIFRTSWSIRNMKPRWVDCIKTDDPATIHLFVRKYFRSNTKTAVDTMIRNIKESFENLIRNSDWLSLGAKEAAREKLRRMIYLVGYPEWYDDERALIDYYTGLRIGDSYLENVFSLMKTVWRAKINSWGKPMRNQELDIGALEVDAYYDEQKNALVVPVAAFQLPLFDGSLPHYVEYGVMSSTIGHEMGHAFDEDGIDHGIEPGMSLLTDDMTKIYSHHAQCFIDAFVKYSEKRGSEALDEIIADWHGIQASFHAYKEVKDRERPDGELKLPEFHKFSDEQMFFISFAQSWCSAPCGENVEDPHSPGNLRVIETVSNTLAFVETFNCPKNSPMNPKDKCNIWMKPSVTS